MRALFLVFAGFFAVALLGCDSQEATTAPPIDPPVAGTVVLFQGAFTGKEGQATTGGYQIERTETGDMRLRLTAAFRTDPAPDLHVLLSPTEAAAATHANALATGALILDELAYTMGEQVYDLPDDLALGGFRSVLIHCVQYRHLFGAAPLG